MIPLDTGILSEAMKPASEHRLQSWLDAQRPESLFISSVSVGEILYAIGLLPVGSGKDQLAKALERTLNLFSGRTLTFDTVSAFSFAEIAIAAKDKGKSYAVADAYQAAIAAGHGLTLASRTPALYESFGVLVIEPGEQ